MKVTNMIPIARRVSCRTLCIVLFVTFGIVSCDNRVQYTGREDDCLTRYIREDLRDNPRLKKIGDPVVLERVQNGYVSLAVLGVNPFSQEAVDAIKRGTKLPDIERTIDSSVDVLIETEDIIKKISGVKAVSWTAYKKVASSSSAGYQSGPMSAGESGMGCPKR